MIFAEFYGPSSLFADTLSTIEERIAAVMHARREDVVVRRIEAESDYSGTEIWIELSSEEQLARHAAELSQQVTAAVRLKIDTDVWVLFRIVPLNYVYLNGQPRRRGLAGLE